MASSKTKQERHKRLLAAGFFPENLPPNFVSTDLGRWRNAVLKALFKKPDIRGQPWYYRYTTSPHSILLPRYKDHKRRFSLLNPISYFLLSNLLSENWVTIRKSIKTSKYSLSVPAFDWTGDRAIARPNFSIRDQFEGSIATRFNYIASSDISRFYHSIYTHTIPWALHGKKTAKLKRNDRSLLGNKIDALVRNAQDGQTIGIPVGPDTSRIIGEIIGSGIDQIIENIDTPKRGNFIRFVDDISAGADTLEAAEHMLSTFRKAAHTFELEPNDSKNTTRSTASYRPEGWRHEIRAVAPKADATRGDFERFFSQLFAVADKFPHYNVCTYGLKNASRQLLMCDDWQFVENSILLCYRAEPATLPLVASILVNRNRLFQDLDEKKIRDFAVSNIRKLIGIRAFGELVWILSICGSLKIEIDPKVVAPMFEEEEPLVALVLCLLNEKGLVRSLDKKKWNVQANRDGLQSPMWLYAYESALKQWNGLKSDAYVRNDIYFGELYKRKIKFFDTQAEISDVAAIRHRDIAASRYRKLSLEDILDDLEIDLQDFDEEIGEDSFY